MRLYSFQHEGTARLGVEVKGQLADLQYGSRLLLERNGAFEESQQPLPGELLRLLRSGPRALRFARAVEALASKRLALPVGERLLYPIEEVLLLPPIARPPKIVCAYGSEGVQDFTFFSKPATSVVGDQGVVWQPSGCTCLIPSSHVAAIIGTTVPRGSDAEPLSCVVGFTLLNDITAPERADAQPMLSRAYDTFCPMGPCLVTTDEWPGPSETGGAKILEKLSRALRNLSAAMTLEVGDVVSVSVQPHAALAAGESAVVEVAGLGVLLNPVASARQT